jgi:pimeloyl-ACP methyl ester carboxylesterase
MTTRGPRKNAQDLRAAGKLAVDATARVTSVVEEMHHTIGGLPARLLSWPVYASIRGLAKIVGVGVDRVLAGVGPLLGEGEPGVEREAARSILNGVIGDYLRDTDNPLAIAMHLRSEGAPRPRLVVLVHGSSMNDRQWLRAGHDHGVALAHDLDATAVYVLYNSGLHVSENGRALAAQLEVLVAEWPIAVDTIALVGHSMGGLVVRSAAHYAEEAGLAWRERLRSLVCLGTPHHGAPLERVGNLLQGLGGVSRFSAPIAKMARLRSAGVTDLRFGNLIDEHWQGRDRFEQHTHDREEVPLPEHVACFALAATTARAEDKGALPGDGLVQVDSALGCCTRSMLFPATHQQIAYGSGHLDLLGAQVYPIVRDWLRGQAIDRSSGVR